MLEFIYELVPGKKEQSMGRVLTGKSIAEPGQGSNRKDLDLAARHVWHLRRLTPPYISQFEPSLQIAEKVAANVLDKKG